MDTYMITAREVLDYSRSYLEKIAPEPEKGWLEEIYRQMSARLFPGSFEATADAHLSRAVDLFMERYQLALDDERRMRAASPVDDFEFFEEEEFAHCVNADEYRRFLRVWREQYIYEYMRLAREVTPFNTCGHVAGVHHLATFIARQIAAYETSTDLGIVSAAAACHDLGKFGCIGDELRKVAHYHYYYTTVICRRFDLPMIGHIAGNHSTWDLEFENLSIESLILIYADFRVRSHREESVEVVGFYTLDEAYSIILSKLENVDQAKAERYRKVYMKLKDFELYLKSLGVETNPEMPASQHVSEELDRDPLLTRNEVTDRLKNLAIRHNIRIMSIFNNESSFGSLLEDARTENNASRIRAYLNILDEYSKYMTRHEKLMASRFLYDQLSNKEGDIRRKAAETLGKLIARYRSPITKLIPDRVMVEPDDSLEVWRAYLGRIVYPGHRVTDQHRSWIRYTLKIVTRTLIANVDEDRAHGFLEVFLDLFSDRSLTDEAGFAMVESLVHIPFACFTEDDLLLVVDTMSRLSANPSIEAMTGIIDTIEVFSSQEGISESFRSTLSALLGRLTPRSNDAALQFLCRKAYRNLHETGETDREIILDIIATTGDPTSRLMRDNLKTATHWVTKTANISFLLNFILNDADDGSIFYLASHLSNLLKVSEKVTVRKLAGKSLVKAASKLPAEKINELVIELAYGLEIGDYQFSKYIPEYLGALSMYLQPSELDEFIGELGKMLDSSNHRIASVALDTVGEILQDCFDYDLRETPDDTGLVEREKYMLGLLLKGISNYDSEVSRKALLVIGQYIFGSSRLSLERKCIYYRYINKKLLTLLCLSYEKDIAFYNNAAALNHVYRFISDYSFSFGEIVLAENSRIAFFPGTFDPFSSGHRGIVEEIRKMGFETYLALDEFSWSKNTQPRKMRRKIISMSIASCPDVFLFLDDFPVNIANPDDIARLKRVFEGKDVYMVAGSDVIINASSYRKASSENSIHSMNHIIFRRESAENGDESAEKLRLAYSTISGEICELTLPTYLEDISSTQIRNNIDDGRDISKLIDPVAQSYIYDNSMYLREPMYKSVLETRNITIENDLLLHEAFASELASVSANADALSDYLGRDGVMYTSVRGSEGQLGGAVLYHEIDTSRLFAEFMDFELASHIRQLSPGRMLVIRSLEVFDERYRSNLLSILLTEVLAGACERGITYGIYQPLHEECSELIKPIIRRYGFLPIELSPGAADIYAVDMKSPLVVVENMDTVIKSPFNSIPAVAEVLSRTHARLQQAIADLLPGSLVLSFNAGIMNNRIVHMVTRANGVPDVPTVPRQLGPDMCVPFGKFLGNVVIPNTVTKTIHTEKRYTAALDSFTIEEYPMYSSIENQIRTIKSFNRPVILVDDILHKGYRLEHMDPIMKANEIDIKRIIVGVLSGRGRDLMALQGREVESAYFIPNLRSWFVESTIYPFIGGDSVDSKEHAPANLIVSINLMPPFAAPSFLYRYDREAAYRLASTCLENSKEIFTVLEEEYLNHFERQLTIRRLSDVIKQPRKPVGSHIGADELSMRPSSYMDDYIDRLKRLRTAML